ncbi:MAG: hypothetical protein ACKV2Q_36710 [Planctomycetaceae bacterium]
MPDLPEEVYVRFSAKLGDDDDEFLIVGRSPDELLGPNGNLGPEGRVVVGRYRLVETITGAELRAKAKRRGGLTVGKTGD